MTIRSTCFSGRLSSYLALALTSSSECCLTFSHSAFASERLFQQSPWCGILTKWGSKSRHETGKVGCYETTCLATSTSR